MRGFLFMEKLVSNSYSPIQQTGRVRCAARLFRTYKFREATPALSSG